MYVVLGSCSFVFVNLITLIYLILLKINVQLYMVILQYLLASSNTQKLNKCENDEKTCGRRVFFLHRPSYFTWRQTFPIISVIEQLGRAAQGACHVRGEPRVDAVGVEHVTAEWDELDSLPLLELAQADWAVVDHPVLGGLSVRHQRQRLHEGGVEAAAHAVWWGAGRGGGRGGLVGGGDAADIDVEEAHEEEGGEDDDNGEGHGGVELGGGVEGSPLGGGVGGGL